MPSRSKERIVHSGRKPADVGLTSMSGGKKSGVPGVPEREWPRARAGRSRTRTRQDHSMEMIQTDTNA